MFQYSEEAFAGHLCVGLSNGLLTLHVMKDAGPRIIGLQAADGRNLMAEVPLEPGDRQEAYIPYGGQRLWHAPEHPLRTYQPDNSPVEIEKSGDSLLLRQATEPLTGIQKSITIRETNNAHELVLTHTLQNHGLWPVKLNAWPICQLRTGGFSILPLSSKDNGLSPNRNLVFWPYADILSENLVLGNRYLFVKAAYSRGNKTKVGWLNEREWLAYFIEGTLFVKRARYFPAAEYIDLGCSTECYCDHRFLELETIGPSVLLEPEVPYEFLEKWSIFTGLVLKPDEAGVEAEVARLGLDGAW